MVARGGHGDRGFAAGLLHTAIFHAISPMYRHDPAATVNLAGILFGSGCFTVAILISGTFYIYTAAAVQVWIAVIPALFGWMYWKTPFGPACSAHASPRHIFRVAQHGRGSIEPPSVLPVGKRMGARRLASALPEPAVGISPPTALGMLALYWLALT